MLEGHRRETMTAISQAQIPRAEVEAYMNAALGSVVSGEQQAECIDMGMCSHTTRGVSGRAL